ncbi:MAG: dihydropteroate synthase [Vicinamibacterales bacterium]
MIAAPRRPFTVPIPGRAPLVLGPRTLVMGVINVTPDSFSDSGRAIDPARALDIAQEMEAAGADILDLGGESTRPGASPVGSGEELARIRPVLKAMAGHVTLPISIDTYKASVAAVALDDGASIVNDISGLSFDTAMGALVASRGVPVVLMHTRGRPQDMSKRAEYNNVVDEVATELLESVDRAVAAGVAKDCVILDPGLGFAKQAAHSMETLARLERFAALGFPLLVGPSRKSFLMAATGPLPPEDRDWPTAAAVTAAVLGGAHVVRVHAVSSMVPVVRVSDAVRNACDS